MPSSPTGITHDGRAGALHAGLRADLLIRCACTRPPRPRGRSTRAGRGRSRRAWLARLPRLACGLQRREIEAALALLLQPAHILEEAQRADAAGHLLVQAAQQMHLVARPRHLVLEALLLLGELDLLALLREALLATSGGISAFASTSPQSTTSSSCHSSKLSRGERRSSASLSLSLPSGCSSRTRRCVARVRDLLDDAPPCTARAGGGASR